MFSKTDIYRYSVGTYGEFAADPLLLRRRILIASAGHCYEMACQAKEYEEKMAEVGDAVGDEADAKRAEFSMRLAEVEGKLVAIAFEAFNLVPVDEKGRGVTELQGLELLYDFLDWLDQKKSPPETSPTASPTGE